MHRNIAFLATLVGAAEILGCGARAAIDVPSTSSVGAGGATTSSSSAGVGGAPFTTSSSAGVGGAPFTTSSSSGTGGAPTTSSSSGTGGAPTTSSSSGGGGVVQLATFYGPFQIALDQDYVYVVDWGSDSHLGQVVKLPKAGGEPFVLAANVGGPAFMAADATTLYVTTSAFDFTLQALPKQGGAFTQMATWPQDDCDPAVDADHVYCAMFPSGRILAFDKGSTVPTELGQVGLDPRGLVADDHDLFWGNDFGVVVTMPKSGGAAVTLSNAPGRIWNTAIDATRVYWGLAANPSQVMAIPKGGGTATVLATDAASSQISVAVDESNVYWTNPTAGTVSAVPKDGGPVTVIAAGQNYPSAIAVDDSGIYWANQGSHGGGSVMRLPK